MYICTMCVKKQHAIFDKAAKKEVFIPHQPQKAYFYKKINIWHKKKFYY